MTAVDPHARVLAFLHERRLLRIGQRANLTPLTGGVSSDLWKVELPTETLCVKGSSAQLKVAHEWHAPTSRNAVECDWLAFAAAVCPGQVPRRHRPRSRSGPVRDGVPAAGELPGLEGPAARRSRGRHRRTAGRRPRRPAARGQRRRSGLRRAVRHRHQFRRAANQTVSARHRGSASGPAGAVDRAGGDDGPHARRRRARRRQPEEHPLGPDGPVLLDAECAWFGDPAFDIAFCLNHLLLKSVKLPGHAAKLVAAARALAAGHARHIDWEPPEAFEARAVALLPALALARVDGASPVEYLDTAQRQTIRGLGRALLRHPVTTLDELLDHWAAPAASTATLPGSSNGHPSLGVM